jgi:hypothetical protein
VRVHVKARGWLQYNLERNPTGIEVPEGLTASGVLDLLLIPAGP